MGPSRTKSEMKVCQDPENESMFHIKQAKETNAYNYNTQILFSQWEITIKENIKSM